MMIRLPIRLFQAAALFLVLAGFASPMTVHAEGTCASGGGSDISSSPKFSVHAGDVVTARVQSHNSADTVVVALVLDHSSPAGNSGTGSASVSYVVRSADHIWAIFEDFTGPPFPGFSWSININGGCSRTGPLFNDGRLNSHDGAETAAIYCDKGGLDIFYIGDPWQMVLKVTAHEIDIKPTHPATNILIKENAKVGVALYRLTTGELQVNAPGGSDGKGPYVFIFSDCPRN